MDWAKRSHAVAIGGSIGLHSNRSLWSRARHYERWQRDIAGFVSLGDIYQLVASPLSLLLPKLVLSVAFASLRRRFSRKLLLSAPADTSILPALSLEAGE